MPLKDRRSEYFWPQTKIANFVLIPEKKVYSENEQISIRYSFRLRGGLREALRPDVWTLAWEDYDKYVILHYYVELIEKKAISSRKLLETGKRVRKVTFYWSRDPDLPYRIWAAIIPEDGGAPIIPNGVEDAKSRFLNFEGQLSINASEVGKGKHKLFAVARVKWFRRSFIEKGKVESSSENVEITVL